MMKYEILLLIIFIIGYMIMVLGSYFEDNQ